MAIFFQGERDARGGAVLRPWGVWGGVGEAAAKRAVGLPWTGGAPTWLAVPPAAGGGRCAHGRGGRGGAGGRRRESQTPRHAGREEAGRVATLTRTSQEFGQYVAIVKIETEWVRVALQFAYVEY